MYAICEKKKEMSCTRMKKQNTMHCACLQNIKFLNLNYKHCQIFSSIL